MTDLDSTNSNGNGAKVPILPMLLLLITAAVAALTTWVFRVDDRLYALIRDVPTRSEIQLLRADLTTRLDRIEAAVTDVLASPRSTPHP